MYSVHRVYTVLMAYILILQAKNSQTMEVYNISNNYFYVLYISKDNWNELNNAMIV